MLFNRITRFLVAPTISNVQLVSGISSSYTQQSSFYDYVYKLTFTFNSTYAPPPPDTTVWRARLQKSTDTVTWVDTSVSFNLPAISTNSSWDAPIPVEDRTPNTRFRIAIFTNSYNEFVTASSFVTTGSSIDIATYQVYGPTLIYAATSVNNTGIAVPTYANRLIARIVSSGGDGVTGDFFGAGGGGGRYVVTSAISINSNYVFDISYSLAAMGACGITCTTTGDRLFVNNAADGVAFNPFGPSVPGAGATTDLYKEGIFNVAYTTALNGTTGIATDAGVSQGRPWGSDTPSITVPGGNALMAEGFGFGGNGAVNNAIPANGSGGIVQITFSRV